MIKEIISISILCFMTVPAKSSVCVGCILHLYDKEFKNLGKSPNTYIFKSNIIVNFTFLFLFPVKYMNTTDVGDHSWKKMLATELIKEIQCTVGKTVVKGDRKDIFMDNMAPIFYQNKVPYDKKSLELLMKAIDDIIVVSVCGNQYADLDPEIEFGHFKVMTDLFFMFVLNFPKELTYDHFGLFYDATEARVSAVRTSRLCLL